ncbi:trypsin-like peptidase domain-containing protein [Stieleria sp. JC731]|uniref:trypsin-like peptidase domain-containing protein n=1 Tax=Pirellulaceae TaxID=2691357 RepID=UPI001E4C7974|nr:trypsin-like peptidase domain-containing protein [Stieleria sp. JC731]MCC9600533.1 trypsin-like peptidase domain-containing protein [Stieleria sp. JC731]
MLDFTMFGRLYGAAVAAFVFFVSSVTGVGIATAKPVLLAFSSEHCGHCKAMEPALRQMELGGTPIRHIDINRESGLAQHYGVRQVPTFVVLSGGRELTRLVGAQSVEKLQHALQAGARTLLPVEAVETNVHQGQLLQNHIAAPQAKAAAFSAVGEPMPSMQRAEAVERARAATVRLRVKDGHGFGVGTGTIIDRHDGEALVLTCGHLFRETKLQSNVEVDLFIGNQVRTVPGQVIDYDAGDRDIGLVAIRPGCDVAVAPLINVNEIPQNGQSVFSFGCDRGADPSRRDTSITGVDKYNPQINASNIEIAGAPIDGRSGGGLFDEQGRVIGVCNAADYNDDIGIYTGPRSIAWQMSRINMQHLCSGNVTGNPASAVAAIPATVNQAAPQTRLASLQQSMPAGGVTAAGATATQEMIVIIRDASQPNGQRVINVRQPTAELLNMIEHSAAR